MKLTRVQTDVPLLASFKKLSILKFDIPAGWKQELKKEILETMRKVLAELPPLPLGRTRQLWYAASGVDESQHALDRTWGRRARANWKEGKYDTVEYI